MLYHINAVSPSSPHSVLPIPSYCALVHPVKVETLDPIVKLSRKFEGESLDFRLQETSSSIPSALDRKAIVDSKWSTSSNSPSQSSFP